MITDAFSNVIKTSSRWLQDVFKVCLQDLFERRHQDVFKTSSRCPQNVFARRFQVVSKTCSRRICKTSSWRRLQEDVWQLCLESFLKTSSRSLERQRKVVLKTSSRRLQDIFSTSSPKLIFAGLKMVSGVEWPGSFWMF